MLRKYHKYVLILRGLLEIQNKLPQPMFKYRLTGFRSYLIPLFALLLLSCSSPKNTNLFQTIPYNSEIKTLITKDFEHKVKADDLLSITIVSPSEEAKNYNTFSDGYLVDKNGNIQLYKIGDVKVEGLTVAQVKDRVTKLLVPDYFNQASVAVRFRNHKIVVIGEVASQGVVKMETEHISIVEALATQGGLTPNSRRDNILVIRNTESGKLFYRINLLDGSVFNSDFYYLQANDIVYVEPIRRPISEATRDYLPIFAALTSLTTLIVVIAGL